jgi:5-methylcytosine-specific restriction endonuclease McrA
MARFSPEQKAKRAAYLRAWKAANPDKVKAHNAAIYQKHRESRLLREKIRRDADVLAARRKHNEQRAKNPDRIVWEAEYREKNRQKIRAAARARHYRNRKEILAELSEIQKGRCAYCREKISGRPHIDHIMPKSLGGSNDRSNLQLTCSTCNLTKNARHPIEFARLLGRLL